MNGFNPFFNNNNFMPNCFNNNMMPGMNLGGNESWISGYGPGINFNMGQMQVPIAPGSNKINIVFKTTANVRTNVVADYGKTVSDIILLYLKRVGREELFKKDSGICFLNNAKKIDIYDKTKVEIYFKNTSSPLIIVNDVQNLIGARII